MYIDTLIVTHDISPQLKEREKYILQENQKGNMDIKLKILSYSCPFLVNHDVFFNLSYITEDNTYFVNTGTTKYYDINSITEYIKDK